MPMSGLDLATRRFWSAALFARRAPERNQEYARAILKDIAANATGPLQERAAELVKERDNGTGRSHP